MRQRYRWLGLPLALLLLLTSLGPSLALDRQTRLEVMSAVVQVWIVWEEDGRLKGVGIGSGTIISPDGLILTNYHVAGFDEFPIDYLGIGLTIKSDQPPKVAYLGEMVAGDPYLDLAVIRITHDIDLTPIAPGELDLPYLELGDSNALEVGDDLNIFGYPGIGGETVTFTRGVVSGFTLDQAIEGRAWIKTDTTIAGGNSGGTAVDESGRLVAVPTRLGSGGAEEYADCRVLQDTNNDGRIDEKDTCIPLGGFLNALRPVNLALPLIEAARRGIAYQGQGASEGGPTPTGRPRLGNLLFAPGVTEFNQPTTVVASLPSGARSLYLFFDYENMSSDMAVQMRTQINGRDAPDWGWETNSWGGGETGVWWIGWDDADLVDGTYTLALYVDGDKLAEAEIEIGGRPTNEPSFANIVLSLEKTSRGGPAEPTVLFPAGAKELYAFFDYDNMTGQERWTRTWFRDGKQLLTKTETWRGSRSGDYSLQLTARNGLAAGAYRLELLIDGRLVAMSHFWVTGSRGGGASFTPITFAEGIDRRGNPVGAARSFASGLEELHAFSEYEGMEDGLDFMTIWYIDDQKVVEMPYEWDSGESGPWHYRLYSSSGPLPDGKYSVELLVAGQVLQSGTTTIGAGGRPTPAPTPEADGVQVQGTITDLDTGRPIAGAAFLVLKPGITINSFQWTDDEVYTAAETDRNGYYKLPRLLERGECYSMIIGAEGYWPYGEDDVCVERDTQDIVELSIRLEKK